MIDDGSTDNSRYIIEKYALDYDNFYAFHKKNDGLPITRNYGLKFAKGEYVYFMDSDDSIVENTIELMMQNVSQYNAEVVFGSYKKIETSGKEIIYQYPALQLLGKDELACFAYRKYDGIQASACNYLVKTSVLRENNHRFINTNFWEDFVFTFDLVTLISRTVLLPDITYLYFCGDL